MTCELLQVTCIALLHAAQARAEREAAKVSASKSRRSNSSSSSSSSVTAFDIQSTVHVAAVLQRIMLLCNIIQPAVVIRCCQVKCHV